MKSIFDKEAYQEIQDRVARLKSTDEGQWGKMTVGQMVWHCQVPLKVGISNKPNNKKGNLLVKWFFKKSLYNDKPWRKNLPTSPFAKATEAKDFDSEREMLQKMISQFHELNKRESWNPHPLFGRLSHDQWGKMQYKHLDHHLRQFGV
ncbi:MAG: DUF1569 domain-containing protein [Muriicola sp.]|nr:DUF1569 domain-containing protein [Muriicola sp.]NNK10352.1 DUF1569 domain-containing protein [Flavobacteriaceae bacterium]